MGKPKLRTRLLIKADAAGQARGNGDPPVPENLQLGHGHWTQPEPYVHTTPALSSPCSATDAQVQSIFHGQLPCPAPPQMHHQQGVTRSSRSSANTPATSKQHRCPKSSPTTCEPGVRATRQAIGPQVWGFSPGRPTGLWGSHHARPAAS